MRAVGRLARPRLVAVLVVMAALLLGAWLWLRDSSLVAVKRLTVTGVSGPDATQIRSALAAAAHNMTTLDVREDQLRTAVAPYPVVKDLHVSTEFPHGLRISVVEQVPVAVVTAAGRQLPVAGDGTLLHDVRPSASLPTIPLSVPPGGSRLSDPAALSAVGVLAAAPYALLGRISQVTTDASRGLAVSLRNGPTIYFGDTAHLSSKWIAAIAVLGDSGSAGASYLDVSDPGRPVAGAGSDRPTASAGHSSVAAHSAAGPGISAAAAPAGASANPIPGG